MVHGFGITYAFHTCEEIGFDSLEPIVSTAMAMQRIYRYPARDSLPGNFRRGSGASRSGDPCLPQVAPTSSHFSYAAPHVAFDCGAPPQTRPRLLVIHRASYVHDLHGWAIRANLNLIQDESRLHPCYSISIQARYALIGNLFFFVCLVQNIDQFRAYQDLSG